MAKKVIVFGTRPEFIKLIPVFKEIKKQGLDNDFLSICTGQHGDMLDELMAHFHFTPDYSIASRDHGNSLVYSFSFILSELQICIDEIQRHNDIRMMIAQGDTTSTACTAQCAFFNNIPFGHIEAGLRTQDLGNPFPEEYYRKMISLGAAVHFVPGPHARENLLREGVPEEKILLTGNTIVDVVAMLKPALTEDQRDHVLITYHRRENQNGRFHAFTDGLREVAATHPELKFIWISHQSPFIRENLLPELFGGLENITMIPPLLLTDLYALLGKTCVIITDSGGLQEEAPDFNIPVIVVREKTERTESVDLGYSRIVPNPEKDLLRVFNEIIHFGPISMINPYGDGHAAQKIVNCLLKY
jgi:UDP-N-acetylglucosamine 2-epimerase